MFTEIRYEVDGPAAVITLDRPEQLNAFTGTMLGELLEAFDRADADDAVRAVIVTGAGRAFCAGADLSAGGETFDLEARGVPAGDRAAPRDGGGILTLRIFESTKPVIAAINGSAVGVGISMTLPMDIRVLADHAKVGFVFAGRGIAPDGAASWFLPRIVGIDQALEWVLTARVFRAQEALDGGLVRSIHPAGEVLDVAKGLAEEIATNAAPVSAAVSRGLLWRMLGAPHPMAAHRADSAAIFDLGRKSDAREGVVAFLEKRQPSWTLSPTRDLPASYPWWDNPTYEGDSSAPSGARRLHTAFTIGTWRCNGWATRWRCTVSTGARPRITVSCPYPNTTPVNEREGPRGLQG